MGRKTNESEEASVFLYRLLYLYCHRSHYRGYSFRLMGIAEECPLQESEWKTSDAPLPLAFQTAR